MYQTIVCDDEEQILKEITGCVRSSYEKEHIDSEMTAVCSAERLLTLLDENVVDILFLDIDMPYFTGMDVAKYINDKGMKTLIIFVTSHDTLVYQTFSYRPFGFIRKTYLKQELEEVVKRLSKELENRSENIIVSAGATTYSIKKSDIIYMEAAGNYVNVYMNHGCEKIRETLTHMERELVHRDFIRCHKGYIINGKCVEKIVSGGISMSNGVVIPIGRNYEKEVKRKILELMR